MKSCLLLLGAVTWFTAPILPAAAATADDLWKAFDDAQGAMRQRPAAKPKSAEEAKESFKKLLLAADAAGQAFLDKYPQDARRWKIKLFDAMTAQARPQLGLPEKGDMTKLLTEVAGAADADAGTKGDASAILLLESASEIKEGDAAWTERAQAHLKAFPDQRLNAMIKSKLDSMKVLADLKTKPLDLKFTAVDGHEVDIEKLRGKVVLIDFWATWCGPCVGEVPNVVKTYEKLHPKGFEIIGISLDQDKSKLEAFTRDKNMTWTQFFDGKGWKNEISSRFGINSIPAMWLVDKKGMVVSTNVRGKLEEEVEKRLAE